MAILPPRPTPYPAINVDLNMLLSEVQTVLGSYFVGMIVHGSLASGDFEPNRSDIDFLVVTTSELPQKLLPKLIAMHQQLAKNDSKWLRLMEGSYIPQDALRRHDPTNAYFPALRSDGSFDIDGHDSAWVIQRYIIRKCGIVLAGPDPKTLIDPISEKQLRQAVVDLLHEWWEPKLTNPESLYSAEYQTYAILTMCRMLFTVQKGAVTTKPKAAMWTQSEYGDQWSPLIEEAMEWRKGMELNRLEETMNLIRFTLEKCQSFSS